MADHLTRKQIEGEQLHFKDLFQQRLLPLNWISVSYHMPGPDNLQAIFVYLQQGGIQILSGLFLHSGSSLYYSSVWAAEVISGITERRGNLFLRNGCFTNSSQNPFSSDSFESLGHHPSKRFCRLVLLVLSRSDLWFLKCVGDGACSLFGWFAYDYIWMKV